MADTRDLLELLVPAAGGAAPLQAVAASAVRTCRAHLRALGERDAEVTTPGVDTGTAAGVDTGTAAGTATGAASPAPTPEAPAVLARLLTAAAAALTGATATPAPGGGMARLLVSIGASRALLADDVAAATGVPAGTVLPPPAGDDATAVPHHLHRRRPHR